MEKNESIQIDFFEPPDVLSCEPSFEVKKGSSEDLHEPSHEINFHLTVHMKLQMNLFPRMKVQLKVQRKVHKGSALLW